MIGLTTAAWWQLMLLNADSGSFSNQLESNSWAVYADSTAFIGVINMIIGCSKTLPFVANAILPVE